MNIALLFWGEWRTGTTCSLSVRRALEHQGHNVDCFVHTWDSLDFRGGIFGVADRTTTLNKEDLEQEIRNALGHQTEICISKKDDLVFTKSYFSEFGYNACLFYPYSVAKVVDLFLKTKNKDYDLVVFSRPDLWVHHLEPVERPAGTFNPAVREVLLTCDIIATGRWTGHEKLPLIYNNGVEDIMWFCSEEVAKEFVLYPGYATLILGMFRQHITPEHIFYSFLNTLQIHPNATWRAHFTLVPTELKFDGVEAFLFDLDGTIADCTEWHYVALNRALQEIEGYQISRKDHEEVFNGLPTRVKLGILQERGKVRSENLEILQKLKKEYTFEEMVKELGQNRKDYPLRYLFEVVKAAGYKIGVVTNSIRDFTVELLQQLDVLDLFDIVVTNQDIKASKPSPEPYLEAARKLNISPEECVAFEDSNNGIQSAKAAGCVVVPVTYEKLFEVSQKLYNKEYLKILSNYISSYKKNFKLYKNLI